MNPLNGSDAETRAAVMLTSACRGEVRWGSREEDGAGIDLLLSARHPWYPTERLLALVQVKSGDSYGKKDPQNSGFVLKKRAVAAVTKTSHATFVTWVDVNSGICYWAYIKPTSMRDSRQFGEHHRVTPATVFDFARCSGSYANNLKGGTGITIPVSSASLTPLEVKKKRSAIRKQYFHSTHNIVSPVLGEIELGRPGWRHMFRFSRSAYAKNASLDLIPYLTLLLKQIPNAHRVTNVAYRQIEPNWERREVEHLLRFDGVSFFDKAAANALQNPRSAYIRLIEEVRYPVNWISNPMLSQLVQRRVVLITCYYKDQVT